MSKRLATGTIRNELSGASLFFQRPPRTASGAASAAAPATVPQPPGQADRPTAPEVRPRGVPDARPGGRRRLTRMPFEFYQDQLERLRALSLAAKLRGEPGSMSAMVRVALDQYLAERAAFPPE